MRPNCSSTACSPSCSTHSGTEHEKHDDQEQGDDGYGYAFFHCVAPWKVGTRFFSGMKLSRLRSIRSVPSAVMNTSSNISK